MIVMDAAEIESILAVTPTILLDSVTFPLIEAERTSLRAHSQLVFECPFCWIFGSGAGSCDIDAMNVYRHRPKRAKPMRHVHSAGAGERGAFDGLRCAHCWPGSPWFGKSYYIKEIES